MRMRRSVIVGVGLLWTTAAWAATRTEAVDENGDGRKETVYTYEGKQIVKAESDMNGDGKPDVVTQYKDGHRFSAEADRDFDGRIDNWITYNEKGRLWRSAKDTNKDGKPDQFKEYINGNRELVTEESDTNYDGKIDSRRRMQWDGGKSIPIFTNNRMTRTPNPGYVTIWKEDDTNFDGRIDTYYEKGKPAASSRIGKDIATPAPTEAQAPAPAAGREAHDLGEDKIKELNRRHGF